MKKLHLLLLVIVLTCPSIKAQISLDNPGFFYLDNKHSFNLPQLGIGVDMPAKSGIKVPLLMGEGVYLSLSDTTTYFLDLNYLRNEDSNMFYFNLNPQQEEKAMRAIIMKTECKLHLIAMANKDATDGKLEIIESLINPELGETVSIRIKSEGKLTEQHCVMLDNYYIAFAFELGLLKADKTTYRSIIKSLKRKNFEKEIEAYKLQLAKRKWG